MKVISPNTKSKSAQKGSKYKRKENLKIISLLKSLPILLTLLTSLLFSGCRSLNSGSQGESGTLENKTPSVITATVSKEALKEPFMEPSGEVSTGEQKLNSDSLSKNNNGNKNTVISQESSEKIKETESEEKGNIICEIRGEVKNPGVFPLKEGDRINNLIELAGGLTDKASLNFINRAGYLSDGEAVIIPYIGMTREEYDSVISVNSGEVSLKNKSDDMKDNNKENNIKEKETGVTGKVKINEVKPKEDNPKDKKININTAETSELEKIPGVGPKTAMKIIEYRETYGPFKTTEELKNVDRIGDKTYKKMEPYICVD